MEGVKALFFDVFGTVVDWRTGVAREARATLEPHLGLLGRSRPFLASLLGRLAGLGGRRELGRRCRGFGQERQGGGRQLLAEKDEEEALEREDQARHRGI